MKNVQKLLEGYRHSFHSIPEGSYKENETSSLIRKYLDKLKIPLTRIGNTAILAEIGQGEKTVGIRFNMDGLENCTEETKLSFKSKTNCMHACGHDVELAWAIGLADYFSENPLSGKLKLIFQPAEEGPGDDKLGRDGGKYLADTGAFDGLDALLSLHVDPDLEIGQICATSGTASIDAIDFVFSIKGKSSHLSRPQEGKNPIWTIPKILNRVVVLREKLLSEASEFEFPYYLVLDVSQISAGLNLKNPLDAEINTLPNEAIIKGSSRILGDSMKTSLVAGLKIIAEDFGSELLLNPVAIATMNDPFVTKCVEQAIINCNYQHVDQIKYWKDAAGWTAQKAPVCHGYVGCGQISGKLHTSTFYPPEEVLTIGFNVFVSAVKNIFDNQNKITD